jgi:tetraacyldisaccharide 4'-kinase
MRESVRSLTRAHVLLVTRKSASRDEADRVAALLAPRLRPDAEVAICHLAAYGLVDAITGREEPLSWLAHRTFVATAAVGEPESFFAQIRAAGAVVEAFPFPDHHAFDARDVERLVQAGARRDGVRTP